MLITCYYLNQDFFGYLLAFISGTVRFQGNLLCPSYSPGRSSDWPLSWLMIGAEGQDRGQWLKASLGSDCPQNTETPCGLEQNCSDRHESKGSVADNNSWGCHCASPGSSADPCAHDPPPCTTWWDVCCSPEQLRSRGAKDINKKDKSRTWTQMSDHTHS